MVLPVLTLLNNIAPLRPPTRGPSLTVSHTWGILSPAVVEWGRTKRMALMKAQLVAFVNLNDVVDEEGNALILSSIRHAKEAATHLCARRQCGALPQAGTPDHSTPCYIAPTELELISAIVLHEAVTAGRLTPREVHEELGSSIGHLVKLTTVETWRTAFHAAVYRSLRHNDGWAAAMLLEARSSLLCKRIKPLCP